MISSIDQRFYNPTTYLRINYLDRSTDYLAIQPTTVHQIDHSLITGRVLRDNRSSRGNKIIYDLHVCIDLGLGTSMKSILSSKISDNDTGHVER